MSSGFVTAVREEMVRRSNGGRAIQMAQYMKHVKPFRGISSRDVQEIVNASHKHQKWLDFSEIEMSMRDLWDGEYREDQYAAIRLGRKHIGYFHSLLSLSYLALSLSV
jgi:hypothetical protein